MRLADPPRFTTSAATREGRDLSTEQFYEWFAERGRRHEFRVDRIPFDKLDGWHFRPGTGELVHDSGRFFAVEGLHVRTDRGAQAEWWQPIINQPEVGILGVLVKEFDGVLHCLMQAKMEPGNVNSLQLSPTVQATRSNYTKVHRGAATPYLEYFVGPDRGRVLVDTLQSEQGSWFYRKRNRNMVVEVTGDVPTHEDFRWLTLGQLRDLHRVPNLINMDARSVLSCLPYPDAAVRLPAAADDFAAALRRALDPDAGSAPHTLTEIVSWLNDVRTGTDLVTSRVPLTDVVGWYRSDDEIFHADRRHFSVIAVAVEASSREVRRWAQPLLAPCGLGVVAFLSRRVDGVLQVLARVAAEPGFMDVAELGPTVQCLPDSYLDLAPHLRPPYLDYVLEGRGRVRYDVRQSEEGGRFYHAESRYLLIEVEDGFPDPPEEFRWVTVGQLVALLRQGNYLNVQARSLLSCLHALW